MKTLAEIGSRRVGVQRGCVAPDPVGKASVDPRQEETVLKTDTLVDHPPSFTAAKKCIALLEHGLQCAVLFQGDPSEFHRVEICMHVRGRGAHS